MKETNIQHAIEIIPYATYIHLYLFLYENSTSSSFKNDIIPNIT